MFKVNGIDHINLQVPNLEKAQAFYEKFFGLQTKQDRIIDYGNGIKRRFMLIGESNKIMLCLYENEEVDYKNSPLAHIGINVENYDEVYKLAKEHGIVDERYGEVEWDHAKSVYIKDPNGLSIEVTEKFGGGH